MSLTTNFKNRSYPSPRAALELIKPITWFPPMWAFMCGAVSSGSIELERLWLIVLGVLLAGPIVCGMSQAANDWCDRHVDAINEPNRPIPSGRMPEKWGLFIAIFMSVLSLSVGYFLGTWGFYATLVGVICAWLYSVEPFRLKRSGIFGPLMVGLCYEGLPWFTGAAVLSTKIPKFEIILVASLYALGAYGIMVLNDFKAVVGDKQTGIKSLPVLIGTKNAARVACTVMIVPQLVIILLLIAWNLNSYASVLSINLLIQIFTMSRLLTDPEKLAPWYNKTGVTLFVLGMMLSALGISSIVSL